MVGEWRREEVKHYRNKEEEEWGERQNKRKKKLKGEWVLEAEKNV